MADEIINKINDNFIIQEESLQFGNIIEDSDQEAI
jgi:hypothetical protein